MQVRRGTSSVKSAGRPTTCLLVFLACAFFALLMVTADVDAASVQISELCGTSNMQSISSSGFAGGEGTQFASLRCDPSIGGYVVKIFNGAGAIDCGSSLVPAVRDYVQFSVSMSCSGPENGGRGVTGSIKIPQNGTEQLLSSVINLGYGITSDEIPVLLDNQDLTIAGRTCSLTLNADLRAKDLFSERCVDCLATPVFTTLDTCGSQDFSNDCSFFDLVCQFDEGTWYKSAFFWILLDLIVFMLVPIFVFVVMLDQRRMAERRIFRKAMIAEVRRDPSYPKKQYMRDVLDKHAATFNHGGSAAVTSKKGEISSVRPGPSRRPTGKSVGRMPNTRRRGRDTYEYVSSQ